MVAPRDDFDVTLTFQSGLNTTKPQTQILETECTGGKNFLLDFENGSFKPREGFVLLGTATNTSEIRGFAQLIKSTGEVSSLVQAGNTVYDWDGAASFSSVGTVDSSARLRGPLSHNWLLDDVVLITDLELREPVKQWNGTTFQDLSHNLGGEFKAKYAGVIGERAYFANVVAGIPIPHMIVGSEVSEYKKLSISDKPSTALGSGDPFYLLAPDLRPVNGFIESFGQTVFSTKEGRLFQLTGSNATDFDLDSLYAHSAATGDESIAFIGNDIVYGRMGQIESLQDTLTYGDVRADDLSRWIASEIAKFDQVQTLYDPAKQRVYFWPPQSDKIYVFNKNVVEASPWSVWDTEHSTKFRKTAATILRLNGVDRLVWGDSSGNIYAMDGGVGDPSSTNIVTERISRPIYPPLDARAYDLKGYVRYKRIDYPITVSVSLLFSGETSATDTRTITIGEPDDSPAYFGGSYYFGGTTYFGFNQEPREQRIRFAGNGRGFRVKTSITSTGDFEIEEIGLQLEASS